jgi:hypothetical protein
MMGLVKPFIDRHVKKIPYVAFKRILIAYRFFTAFFRLSAQSPSGYGTAGATVLRPLLREYGFGPQAIQYLCGSYKK